MSSWRKGVTLRAFPPTMPTSDRLDLAAECGYEGVEVNLEDGTEYDSHASTADLEELRAAVESRGMAVTSVYSREQWLSPLTSADPEVRTRGMALVRRLISAAHTLGTDAVLVVPGAVDNSHFAAVPELVRYDVAYANAQAALRELLPDAERAGVSLALENVWNKFLLSPLEFRAFVDELDSPAAGVYLDVGNVLATGFPEHWLELLGTRVRRVHFKDFRVGHGVEGFVGLLEGDVNWPAVRRSLVDIGYDGWITAEVLPHYRHHPERLISETAASIDAILASPPRAVGA